MTAPRLSVALGLLLAGSAALADEPPPPAPPAAPSPPLPETVRRVDGEPRSRFVLSGGNVFEGRLVGEDPEFHWVEHDGQLARIARIDVVAIEPVAQEPVQPAEPVRARVGVPPAPTVPAASTYVRPPRPGLQSAPDDDDFVRPPRPRPGRGMTIWGSLLFAGSYGAAAYVAAAEPGHDDGLSLLRLVPVIGPFLYVGAADTNESTQWLLDGGLQVLGGVLLTLGIRALVLSRPGARFGARLPGLWLARGRDATLGLATWSI